MTAPAVSTPKAPTTSFGSKVANAASATWRGFKVCVKKVKDAVVKVATGTFNLIKNTAKAIWNSKVARYLTGALLASAATVGAVFLGLFIAKKIKEKKEKEGSGDLPKDSLPKDDLSKSGLPEDGIPKVIQKEKEADADLKKDDLPQNSLPDTIQREKESEKPKAPMPPLPKPMFEKEKEPQKQGIKPLRHMAKERPQFEKGKKRLPQGNARPQRNKAAHVENKSDIPLHQAEKKGIFSENELMFDDTLDRALDEFIASNKEDGKNQDFALDQFVKEMELFEKDAEYAKTIDDDELAQILQDEEVAFKLVEEDSLQKQAAAKARLKAVQKQTVLSTKRLGQNRVQQKIAVQQPDGKEAIFTKTVNVRELLSKTKEAYLAAHA